jgi:hypothetical protein
MGTSRYIEEVECKKNSGRRKMKFLRRQKYQGCGIKAEWRNGIQIEGGWRRILNRDGTVLECKESFASKGSRYIKIEVWGLRFLRRGIWRYSLPGSCIQSIGAADFSEAMVYYAKLHEIAYRRIIILWVYLRRTECWEDKQQEEGYATV